jgi:hypothetical protein
MRALNLGFTNRSTLLLLIVLSFCAQILSAQALPPQKRIRHQNAITPLSSVREKVPDPPPLASIARAALPQHPDHPWEGDPKIASFTAQPRSDRQRVNFNLLLPPSSGKLPSWTADADRDRAIPDRDFNPSAFAATYPATEQGTVNPFIDPQYYARRIPGVGPIVDRVLKQSEAHPRLTRLLKSIQPQF